MEDRAGIFESLLERTEEYSKTSFELLKLKTIDKTSGTLSSVVSRSIAVTLIFMFLIMGSIGLAFWLGDILGSTWYGFFTVAAFYGITAIIVYFFLHNWIKKLVGNLIIEELLK